MRAELAAVAHALPAAMLDEDTAVAIGEAFVVLAEREQGRRLVAAFDRDRRDLERTFARELRGLLDQLGEHVAAQATDPPLSEATVPAPVRSWVDRVLAVVGLRAWAGRNLRPAFEQHWLATAERTVETINAQIGLGVSLRDPVARKVVGEGGRRAGLVDLDEDTRSALFRALEQARAEGLGPKEAARRVRDLVPDGRYVHAGARYRAELIARTETKWAQNVSSLEAYEDADTVTAVLAHDGRLGPTDPDCEQRDGQEFSFADARAEQVKEHPNGTLSWSPIVR